MRRELDCFRALRYGSRLVYGGFAAALAGCALGGAGLARILAGVLAVAGFAALLAGAVLEYRFLVCPHCGEPLYDFPRLPSEIPAHCPHCGKKLDTPADY